MTDPSPACGPAQDDKDGGLEESGPLVFWELADIVGVGGLIQTMKRDAPLLLLAGFAAIFLLGSTGICFGQFGFGFGAGEGTGGAVGTPGADPANATIQAILSAQVDAILQPGGAPVWTSLNFYLEKILADAEPKVVASVSQPVLIAQPEPTVIGISPDRDVVYAAALETVWGVFGGELEKIKEDMAKAESPGTREAIFQGYVGLLKRALDKALEAAHDPNATDEDREKAQDFLDEYYKTRMALSEDREERKNLQKEHDELSKDLIGKQGGP